MPKLRFSILFAALTGVLLLANAFVVTAQPAPSFLSTCGDLRTSLDRLTEENGDLDGELITISVQGPLVLAAVEEQLAYMATCEPPDPEVLCVTYELSGRSEGDVVILTGALDIRGPDFIVLDPCLHGPPDPNLTGSDPPD